MLDQWTDITAINPAWSYDSFARYDTVDENGKSTSAEELYYCTFSDDNGRQYYMVLRYEPSEDGGGLGKVRYDETPYPYDLRTVITDLTAKLAETDLDLSTAAAARVQVTETGKNNAREAILISDKTGNRYVYEFDTVRPAA